MPKFKVRAQMTIFFKEVTVTADDEFDAGNKVEQMASEGKLEEDPDVGEGINTEDVEELKPSKKKV